MRLKDISNKAYKWTYTRSPNSVLLPFCVLQPYVLTGICVSSLEECVFSYWMPRVAHVSTVWLPLCNYRVPHVVSWPIYRLAVSGDLVMTTGLVYRPQLMWSTSSTGPLGDSLQTSPSPLKKKIWNRMINFFRNQDLKSTDYESAMYSSRGYTKRVHKSVINEIL